MKREREHTLLNRLMNNATETNNRGEGDLWKGLVAGLIGGLVASWTMNCFQDVWLKLSVSDHSTGAQTANGDSEQQDDTTVKAASPNILCLRMSTR
jgi:hypothetical protein